MNHSADCGCSVHVLREREAEERRAERASELEAALRALVTDFDQIVNCPAMRGVTAPFGGRELARKVLE